MADILPGHMPWKKRSIVEQRYDLVRQMRTRRLSVKELCEHFRVSRQTGYKWCARYRIGRLSALRDRSRKPLPHAGKLALKWQRRVRGPRQRRPTWGARKLRDNLFRLFGARSAPFTATISRLLRRW